MHMIHMVYVRSLDGVAQKLTIKMIDDKNDQVCVGMWEMAKSTMLFTKVKIAHSCSYFYLFSHVPHAKCLTKVVV